ncbi:MAG: site-specific integrase, partial [Actinobacteria bacterium]|nr:site-specific integrase [Actinomycetota bacterium]
MLERPRTGGERTFSLRIRFKGQRLVIPLGAETEGWNRRRAERELDRVNDQIERGTWRPSAAPTALADRPTLHTYASRWLALKRPTIADKTHGRYRWMLSRHLLRHLGSHQLSEIDHESVQTLTSDLIREREELVEALGRGERPRYSDGAIRKPVSNNTINEIVALLGRILDDAIEDGFLAANPARGRRRRLRAEKRSQPWFESDEFVSLLDAARALDGELGDGRRRTWARTADRSMKARQLRAEGHSWEEIAAAVGVKSPATAHRYAHLAHPELPAVGHRELGVALLGFAGMRASELVNLRWNAIDFAHGRIRI